MRKFNYYCPSLGECWIMAGILILGAVVFGSVLGILRTAIPSKVWALQSIQYFFTMLLPLIFVSTRASHAYKMVPVTGAAHVPVDTTDCGRINPVLYVTLLAAALLSLAVVIDPLGSLIPMSDRFKKLFEEAFISSSLPDMVISACIMAPIFEEFLCRGLILRGILNHTGSPAKAIFWSSFIFAFIHMNPWQAIPAFIIGLLLGWVYFRTGSLKTTIFLHSLNNAVSTALTRIFPDMPADATLSSLLPDGVHLPVYIIAAAILAATLFLLYRRLPHFSKF